MQDYVKKIRNNLSTNKIYLLSLGINYKHETHIANV